MRSGRELVCVSIGVVVHLLSVVLKHLQEAGTGDQNPQNKRSRKRILHAMYMHCSPRWSPALIILGILWFPPVRRPAAVLYGMLGFEDAFQ